MVTIACLHTERSHIAIFEEALRALDFDGIQLLHRVDSSLSQCAMQENQVTTEIAEATNRVIAELCEHADMVIVACIIPGVVACDVRQFSKPVLRVDEMLAKYATRYHGSVLVLCTAHDRLDFITRLFTSYIPADRLFVELVPRAWAYFNHGDIAGYHREIAHYIQQRPECSLGCIVLAQISMTGAEKYINSTLAVLTGPQVSLQAAIDTIL